MIDEGNENGEKTAVALATLGITNGVDCNPFPHPKGPPSQPEAPSSPTQPTTEDSHGPLGGPPSVKEPSCLAGQPLSRYPTLSPISSFSSHSDVTYTNDPNCSTARSMPRDPTLSSTSSRSSISSFSSDSNENYNLKCSVGQPLSRCTTLSSTPSLSSFSSDSSDDGNSNLKLTRILSVTQELNNECRICWVKNGKTTSRSHRSYRCFSKISRTAWDSFKKGFLFQPGQVCFYCLAPYDYPFNHARPPSGVPRSATLCDYPDVLKEVVYLLYENQSLRQEIFARLGDTMPPTLQCYQRYISVKKGGTLGAYNVINAYLDIREEGDQ